MPQTVNQKRLLWPDVLRGRIRPGRRTDSRFFLLCGKSAAARLLRLVLR